MTQPFDDLASVLAEEEKAAFTNALAERVDKIQNMPDGPIRVRIYAAAALIGGAELMAELDSPSAAATQLRRLAARLEATGVSSQ